MTAILISRGTKAGGQDVAGCLSKQGGFRCLTREDLVNAINARGEAAAKVTSALPKAARAYLEFSRLRRPYKILMRLAMLEFMRKDHCAYLGYSGHLLLPNLPQFLRVRLLALESFRVQRTMEWKGIGEQEALDYIIHTDEERLTWCRFMYGHDLRDPLQYDLCINLAKTRLDDVCSILLNAASQKSFQATAESLRRIQDLLLETRVLAELVLDDKTGSLELSATAKAGDLLIQGPYLEEEDRGRVMKTAMRVEGVLSAEYEPGYGFKGDFGA